MRGRNIGNGSIGVSKGKVFYREWLKFKVEWLFWRVQRQRWKVEARTLTVKPREESPLPKLLSLAKYRVGRVDEKSGSRAAALQIATSQYYAGLRNYTPLVLMQFGE